MPRKKGKSKRVWVDPDDAPELTDDFLDRAEIAIGGKVIRPARGTLTRSPGRPKNERPTAVVSLRMDAEIVTALKRGGPEMRKRAIKALERLARKA